MQYDFKHQKILDTAVLILREKLTNLIAVIAFGSFGTEHERKESDLDLAVLTEELAESSDALNLWNIAQEIASAIGRDVDIVNLREASTVFSFQVLTTGTPIYCSNELKLAYFDNLRISMYLRFQEERKELLDDFMKGFFYG